MARCSHCSLDTALLRQYMHHLLGPIRRSCFPGSGGRHVVPQEEAEYRRRCSSGCCDPQIADEGLIIPVLLLWGLGRRRWGFLVGFVGSMGVLIGLSYALVPGWVVEFFQQMTLHPSYTAIACPGIGSRVGILTHYCAPRLGVVGEIGFLDFSYSTRRRSGDICGGKR